MTLLGLALWVWLTRVPRLRSPRSRAPGREVLEVCTSSHAPSVWSDNAWLPTNGTGATR
jgi:hypothetical protein